jgi:hypothetical protein
MRRAQAFTDRPKSESKNQPRKQEANTLPLSGHHESLKKRLIFDK